MRSTQKEKTALTEQQRRKSIVDSEIERMTYEVETFKECMQDESMYIFEDDEKHNEISNELRKLNFLIEEAHQQYGYAFTQGFYHKIETIDLMEHHNFNDHKAIIYGKELKLKQRFLMTLLETAITKFRDTAKNNLTLAHIFKEISIYRAVMNKLAGTYCSEKTFKWCDTESGWKGRIVGLLKALYVKGYFNKFYSDRDLVSIVRNTWGIEITEKTFRNCDMRDVELFSFLPLATTLSPS